MATPFHERWPWNTTPIARRRHRFGIPERLDYRGEVVTPLDELAVEVEGWRRQGLKVGFTNGCFDILHRGHASYLDQARSLGRSLVMEAGLGTGYGHDEAREWFEGWLRRQSLPTANA